MAKNKYEIKDEYVELYLGGRGTRHVAKISIEDLEKVINNPFTWYAMYNGTKLYVFCSTERGTKKVSLHRFLTDPSTQSVIDHINGDGLDNRRCNLRVVSQSANNQNRHFANKNSKSGILGVHWHKKKSRWRARIAVDKKKIHVGMFTSLDEAEEAVKAARAKHMPYSQEALQQRGASF